MFGIVSVKEKRVRSSAKHSRRKTRGKGAGGRGILILVLVVLVAAGAAAGVSFRKGSPLTDGNHPMVKTARAQIGSRGGGKFWSWYGFEEWVDWCGCFVSWCADQNGYLESGDVPQFAYVQEGVNWFREADLYMEAGEEPEPGYIIFFDWNDNDVADHVGIVSGTIAGRVFTIEGNTGVGTGVCARKSYSQNSDLIMGYGIVD